MEEIASFNAYDKVEYKHEEGSNILYITWNYHDKEVDEIMRSDASMRDEGMYYNHFWVNKLKEIIGWVPGTPIYIRSCYMYKGKFHIRINNTDNGIYAYEQIDKDGYLRLRKFNEKQGYYSELEVVDCLYNESLNKML
jgi:hypothetical protein